MKIVLKERRWRCSQYLPDNYLAAPGKAWEKASTSDVFKIPEKLVILSSEVTGELEPQMLKQSWKRSILKVTGKEKKCRWWLHQTETPPNYFVPKSLANPVLSSALVLTSSHTICNWIFLPGKYNNNRWLFHMQIFVVVNNNGMDQLNPHYWWLYK